MKESEKTGRGHWETEARIDGIFARALELEGDEREAYLVAACRGEAELRREVDGLLEAALATDPLLKEGGAFGEGLISNLELPALAPGEGDSLGPYRLVRELGAGGMGVVFLAERADGHFEQQVALKLIHAGAGPRAVERFSRERQILASLQHPNIARLQDGGVTPTGQPYLVMEYVDGEPIDVYCRRRELPVRERVELLCAICSAVEADHRRLIVHRDLKPSNILVADSGEVKLLDFGIAKLLAAETEGAPRTVGQVMTPQYASPEQFLGQPVTVASDVYQVGLIAYELLAGRRPYDLTGVAPAEAQHWICDHDPERPSTARSKIETTYEGRKDRGERGSGQRDRGERGSGQEGSGQEALGQEDRGQTSGAEQGVTTERLAAPSPSDLAVRPRDLTGDLDLIILEALRKDPERRYATMGHLREDLERYLGGYPVKARSDGFGYRLGKWVGRNRLLVASTSAVLLMLLASTLLFTLGLARERDRTRLQAERAQAESERSEQLRRESEQVVTFLEELFTDVSPNRSLGEKITARELLDRGVSRLDAELLDRPLVRARLGYTIGKIYRNLGVYDRAAEVSLQALELRESALGGQDLAVAESLLEVGRVEGDRGNGALAKELIQRSLEIRRETLDPNAYPIGEALLVLGGLKHDLGEMDESLELHQQALEVLAGSRGQDSEAAGHVLLAMGGLLSEMGRPEPARDRLESALAIFESRLGPEHPTVASALNDLAAVQDVLGKADEAVPLYERSIELMRRVYGPDHPKLANPLANLGNTLRGQGRLAEAAAAHEQAIAILREAFGEEHPKVAMALMSLANVHGQGEDPALAVPLFQRALAIQTRQLPENHPDLGLIWFNLGDVLSKLGRRREARAALVKARSIFRIALGEGNVYESWPVLGLARLHLDREEYEAAEPLFRLALDLRSASFPADHEEVLVARADLVKLLRATGRAAEAEQLESPSASSDSSPPPPSSP